MTTEIPTSALTSQPVAYFGKTKLASIRPQQIRAYAKHLEDAGLTRARGVRP
jgi:hypothetical protein